MLEIRGPAALLLLDKFARKLGVLVQQSAHQTRSWLGLSLHCVSYLLHRKKRYFAARNLVLRTASFQLFTMGHFFKAMCGEGWFSLREYFELFSRRHRLQIAGQWRFRLRDK